jgi:hypothetical protein
MKVNSSICDHCGKPIRGAGAEVDVRGEVKDLDQECLAKWEEIKDDFFHVQKKKKGKK